MTADDLFADLAPGKSATPKPPSADALFADTMPKRGAGQRVADTALEFGQGLATGVQSLANVAGAGSDTSNRIGDVTKSLGAMQSPARQLEKQQAAQRTREAAESGSVRREVTTAVRNFAEAPVSATVNALGTSVPTIAATLAGGPVAGLAVGTAQGAGITKGRQYDDVKAKLIEAGVSPEEAHARARRAQAYDGENADQIAIGAGLGALAGRVGIENIIGGRGAVGRFARLRNAGSTAAAEGITEAMQGGHEGLAGNIAVRREGFEDVPLWRGVAGQATEEALAGMGSGAAFGALRGSPVSPQDRVSAELERLGINPDGGTVQRAATQGIEQQAEQQAADSLFSDLQPAEQPPQQRLFPFASQEAASREVARREQNGGQFTVIDHPARPGSFAVVPAEQAPAPTDADAAFERAFLDGRPEPVVLQNRDRSTPASVAQMASIAANPDPSRLGFSRDFANGAPVVFEDSGTLPDGAILGRQDVAVTSDGRQVPVQYAVVEQGHLLPSHNADGTAIAEYAEGWPGLLRPVAGNGRAAGLIEAYSRGTADQYKAGIIADEALHGVPAAEIEAMQAPVLVRVMPAGEVTADIGDVSNTSGTAALSAVEQAQTDAARVRLDALEFTESGGLSADSIRRFVQAMPASEQSGMLDGGLPSQQAESRLLGAVFQQAYQDADLTRLAVQARDPEARTVIDALTRIAPSVAQLEQVGGDLNVSGLLRDVAKAVVNARRTGRPLAEIAAQSDVALDADAATVLQQAVVPNIRSARRMADALGDLVAGALNQAQLQNDPTAALFGDIAPVGRDALLSRWVQDQQAGTVRFSRADSEGSITSSDSFRAAVTERLPGLGRTLDALLDRGTRGEKGGVIFAETADAAVQALRDATGQSLSRSALQSITAADGRVAGMYHPGSGLTVIVGKNTTPESAAGVLLHELAHSEQRADIDARALALIESAQSAQQSATLRSFLDRVAARMEQAGETGNAAEATAYIVEQAITEGRQEGFSVIDGKFMSWVDSSLGKEVGNIVRRFVGAVRAWMMRHGLTPKNITVDDLVAFAQGSARRAARGDVVTNADAAPADTVTVDGVARSRTNSDGRPLHPTDEGVRNFWRWFGDSAVVDAEGRPLVVYHGTLADFNTFDRGAESNFRYGDSPDSGGIFFARTPEAVEYYLEGRRGFEKGANVIPSYVSIRNPAHIEDAPRSLAEQARLLHEAEQAGHDGAIIGDQIIAFRPEQAKSATGNRGTFDGKNPDVRFSQAATAGNQGIPLPQSPRIDSFSQSLLKGGVGLFESGTDKLRRTKAKPLVELADRIERYFDQADARLGWINGKIRPALKVAEKNRKKNMQAFADYWKHHDNGRAAEARAVLDANPDIAPLVDAVKEVYFETGKINQTVQTPFGTGMRVFDGKKGEWRTIGRVAKGRFWPRQLKNEIQAVLQNPESNLELWSQMVDALVDHGNIQTRAEADAFLKDYFSDEVSNDYFAGIEKARGEKLPEMFYEYSWDVFNRYANKWSSRISQAEQFGQVTNPMVEKDAFQQAMSATRDQRTKSYINSLADRVYNRVPVDVYHTLLGHLNLLATGLQLGNPATATLNIAGGTTLNVQMFGAKRIAKAYAELMRDWKRVMQEGTELGILGKDVLNILRDNEMRGDAYLSADNRVRDGLSKFAAGTMKWGGYTGTEQIIRATAMLAAKSQLADALASWNKTKGSTKSKKYIAFMQRNRIDVDKLILENGKGPETARYLRLMVNIPQGSYRIDQTPNYVDTPIGRFLFKYQKFGTQVSRIFWGQFLRPFVASIQGGEAVTVEGRQERVKTFMPLFRYFAAAFLGGGAVLTLRSALFGFQDPGDDWEDIANALADDRTAQAWAMLFSRAHANLIAASAYGMFGNYIQMGLDVADQQRVKNPMEPPGLASIDAVVELIMRGVEQGKLTGKDFEQVAERTIAIYRANKRLTATAINELNIGEFRFAKIEQARRDTMEVRHQARRFADDVGIDARRTMTGRIGRTEFSPENQAIYDAIVAGDGQRARILVREALAKVDPADRQKRLQSIKASIRARHPVQIGGPATRQQQAQFRAWARQNLPPSKVSLIEETLNRYDRTARLAGL